MFRPVPANDRNWPDAADLGHCGNSAAIWGTPGRRASAVGKAAPGPFSATGLPLLAGHGLWHMMIMSNRADHFVSRWWRSL
jgi:hypothetical protein